MISLQIYLEILVCVFKLFITYKIISINGFIYGSLFCYFSLKLYKIALRKYCRLYSLSTTDKYYIGTISKEKINLLSVCIIEKFNPNKIKDLIIERGIKKVLKLRQKLVYKFFDYYWKETSLEEALSRIVIKDTFKLENERDLFDIYLSKEINNQINYYTELPYEFQLISFTNGSGALIFKLDHLLSDEIGIISLISRLSDNSNDKLLPLTMNNNNNKVSSTWSTYMKELIEIPKYFKENIRYMMFSNKEFPFEPTQTSSGITNLSLSTKYDCSFLNNIGKNLGISFDDLIMCIMSKSLKLYSLKKDKIYHNLKKVKCLIPINQIGTFNRNKILYNNSFGTCLVLSLINDIKNQYKQITTDMIRIRSLGLQKLFTQFIALLIQYIPSNMSKVVLSAVVNDTDLIIINVPSQIEPYYFAESKCLNSFILRSTGRSKTVFTIYTYENKITFILSNQQNSDFDEHNFHQAIHDTINDLSESKKID